MAETMDTSDFVPLKEPAAAGRKRQQQRGLSMQPVKLKPKRGRSTKKQKRRQAAKLDKVSPNSISALLACPCNCGMLTKQGVHAVPGHGCRR